MSLPIVLWSVDTEDWRHFVTVTRLFGDRPLKPGTTYHANENAFGR